MTKQLKMIIFRLLIIMGNIHVQCYLVDIIGYDTISKPITVNCLFFVRFTHHLPLFSVEKSYDTHETTIKTIQNQNEKKEQITI